MQTITQFHSIENFTTQRLIAKKLQPEDCDKLLQMHTNSQVMATLGGVWNEQRQQEFLEKNLKHWQDHGFGLWMFYLQATGEWVGRGGVRHVVVAGKEEIEVAYSLMPQFWQQGLASEIAKACTEIAFEILRLKDIVCFTLTTNKASQRVMEKAGFCYEAEIIHADLPHVLYRLKNYRKPVIVPYDSNWINVYQQEKERIQQALGAHLKKAYHIGSTAIPGMPAKPIIDMILECEDLDEINAIAQKLNALGYAYVKRHVIPHRSFFASRQQHNLTFHLHIRERGDPQIKRHVYFRDYLIAHPEFAQAYANLKIELAQKYQEDINSYVAGKDKFIQEIDVQAKLWPKRNKEFLPASTGPLAKHWSQEKIIKAMEANLNVHMTHFAQYLNQVELIRVPGFTLVNSGLADDTFNYVLEADFSQAQAHVKISEITDYFVQRRVPFSWWLSPYDKPENLAELLESQNYHNTENNVAMYLDLDNWNVCVQSIPELEIVQAKDEKTLQDFVSVLTNDEAAFKQYFSWIAQVLTEEDPVEYYVGYVKGKPVVRGLICYFASVAGLHGLSTAADERKKGYGTAMQQFRLQRAKTLGYHVAVLQASQQAYSLYKKLGYKECGMVREFKQQIL